MGKPEKIGRDSAGRFAVGNAGKPRGARNRQPIELASVARTYSSAALATVVDLLRHADADIRLRAAQELFNRGYGRAPQSIAVGMAPPDLDRLSDDDLELLIARIEQAMCQQPQPALIEDVEVSLRDPATDENNG